jgi:hypothetical protein
VEEGQSGELLVTCSYTLKCYHNKPEETDKTYVQLDGKTRCRMGDYVCELPSGELIYQERSADIIKHKAFRVSASEVEAVLQDHPTVIGACVVGVPDPKVGERIKAIVVLKEDARGVGGTELIQWCRERLAAYKVSSYPGRSGGSPDPRADLGRRLAGAVAAQQPAVDLHGDHRANQKTGHPRGGRALPRVGHGAKWLEMAGQIQNGFSSAGPRIGGRGG